jgi:hypothetical protein
VPTLVGATQTSLIFRTMAVKPLKEKEIPTCFVLADPKILRLARCTLFRQLLSFGME